MTFAPLVLAILALPAGRAHSADNPALKTRSDNAPPRAAEAFADTTLIIIDTVLQQHLAPPTRQQMLLEGTKAVLHASGEAPPQSLSRRISLLTTEPALRALLVETWIAARAAKQSPADIQQAMVDGLLSAVPGRPHWVSPQDYKVDQQLRDNLYEGIGIALSYANDEKLPVIAEAFPRGPAREAGAKAGDLIVSADGVEMQGKSLAQIIGVLRGEKGTPITIVVRQPNEEETRTLNMIRGVIPFDTIVGSSQDGEERWNYESTEDKRIAYLKFKSIRGSTVQELRSIARRLQSTEIQAAVLDLRGTVGGDLRHAVMLADELLDEGAIGKVRSASGVREYRSRAGSALNDWPLAVIIDSTSGEDADWIAAALQDNRQAVVVGDPSTGDGLQRSFVVLKDGLGALQLITGQFQRADGRPLAQLAASPTFPHVANVRPPRATGARPPLKRKRSQDGQNGSVVPDYPVSNQQVRPGGNKVDAQLSKAIEVLQAALDGDSAD